MDSKQVKKQTPEEIDELMRPHPQAPTLSPTRRHPEFDFRQSPHLFTLCRRFPTTAPHYPDDYFDAADPSIQAYADSDAFRRLRRHAPVENVASGPPIETVSPQAPNESSSNEEANSDSSATKRSR